jgi:uncharacterized membrane protein YgcG
MALAQRFHEASALEDVGDVDDAIGIYQQLADSASSKEISRDGGVPAVLVASYALNAIAGHKLAAGNVVVAREHFMQAIGLVSGNCIAQLNLANLEREHGNVVRALELYTQIAASHLQKNDSFQDSEEMQMWYHGPRENCITEASYYCALILHQRGEAAEALPYLRRFGFKYRISPQVWEAARVQLSPAAKPSSSSDCPVVLQRNALPPALHSSLLRTFAKDSSFWAETNYPDCGYFSFYYGLDAAPSNTVELLIRHLLQLLPAEKAAQVVGAEWWVHTRAVGRHLGHALHFDTDENTLDASGAVRHPLVSSVVYLSGSGGSSGGSGGGSGGGGSSSSDADGSGGSGGSGGSDAGRVNREHASGCRASGSSRAADMSKLPSGGPTIVLDQTFEGEAAERVFVVHPVDGGTVLFTVLLLYHCTCCSAPR